MHSQLRHRMEMTGQR